MADPSTKRPKIEDPLFQQAVDLIDVGDESGLRAHLAAHAYLLAARAEEDGDFAGHYFASPYLLWFVAENPIRNGNLPANIVDVARTLVQAAREADVESLPEQIDYTLGLVASGLVPRECGVQGPLIQLLAAEGADATGALGTALAHQEMDAARALLAAGAELGLAEAAAVGQLELLPVLFPEAPAERKQRALALAALHGQNEALEWLLERSVDPNQYNPAGAHGHATPLHNAISAGHRDAVRTLLAHGADPTIPDKVYGGTAYGWAEHFERPAIAQILREFRDR